MDGRLSPRLKHVVRPPNRAIDLSQLTGNSGASGGSDDSDEDGDSVSGLSGSVKGLPEWLSLEKISGIGSAGKSGADNLKSGKIPAFLQKLIRDKVKKAQAVDDVVDSKGLVGTEYKSIKRRQGTRFGLFL